jgi:hypothetical protein
MPSRYSLRIAAGVTDSSKKRRMSLTLPPEEKAGSAPVRITTLTDASRAAASARATNSPIAELPVSALRVAGSRIVTVQIAPSRATSRKASTSLLRVRARRPAAVRA